MTLDDRPVARLPWDPEEARQASEAASTAQQDAEDTYRRLVREAAERERHYRVALASEIVRNHDVEHVAWTVAPDLARGEPSVAALRYERDVAVGARDAAGQAAWRLNSDRKDVHALLNWSARRELAEAGMPVPDGKFDPQIFGRTTT